MNTLVRKGQLAKALNISWPTAKYYTKVGLFPITERTPNGQHLYNLPEIRDRFERIKELKRQRHTIDEILDLLKIETIVSQAG